MAGARRRQRPDRGSIAAAVAIQGVVTADRGMTAGGSSLLARSRDIAAELNKPRLEALVTGLLAAAICCVKNRMRHAPVQLARSSSASAGWITFLHPQSLLATADLALGDVEQASAAFEISVRARLPDGGPVLGGLAARGIGLVRAHGRIDEAIAWLDDARTRCIHSRRLPLGARHCTDALCSVAIEAGARLRRASG